MNNNNNNLWSRAIILMDLDAFFASIEQLDYPELRNKPVAVTNGEQGTCIITCSYEARKYGIKTGMRIYDAKKLCPNIIKRPSRPERYAEISQKIMLSLLQVTPDVEVFSVDEAFLDVTHCQRLHGTPLTMAKMVKQAVYDASGLTCSVGVSGDKTTAKYAAKLQKPNGLTVIHPTRAACILSKVPVTGLCGISDGIGQFLANHGVMLCGDMKKIPKTVLKNRFGPLGERIWLMAQALDPCEVSMEVKAPKSIGHGKVLPPNTKDKQIILNFFRHMSEKVAVRLRRHSFEAKKFYIGILVNDNNSKFRISFKLSLENYSNDGYQIYKLCNFLIENYWQGQAVIQVQVTALEPVSAGEQQDLFANIKNNEQNNISNRKNIINKIIDEINTQFGNSTVQPASLLDHSSMPNVIAPSWQPDGVRKTV